MYYNTYSTKYFSWGDIIGKNKNGTGSYSFSKDNYNAGVCGSGHNLTSDIPQGNATYDAARANMGSPWKMFTQEQANELVSGTNYIWTTINGVNGGKFTSKTDTSKYIFFPAAGVWIALEYRNTGDEALYSVTKLHDPSYGAVFRLLNTTATYGMNARYLGQPIRGLLS